MHPGYGFTRESSELARRCAGAGVTFVGPPAEVLDLFGDKARARALAVGAGVPGAAGHGG
ncbi:biotin carboxylase N-terminal domain-containing protein [Streptomyces sp. KL116D]|uniref:biotin carboxylase N-terminal domain-containing protein n=1 Tax=Streptomyces sp. KL116D TaxID=3045152 RepID=UPI003557AC5A